MCFAWTKKQAQKEHADRFHIATMFRAYTRVSRSCDAIPSWISSSMPADASSPTFTKPPMGVPETSLQACAHSTGRHACAQECSEHHNSPAQVLLAHLCFGVLLDISQSRVHRISVFSSLQVSMRGRRGEGGGRRVSNVILLQEAS